MKLNVRSEITYAYQPDTEIIVSVQAASSPDQTILSERLTIEPDTPIVQDMADPRGERRFRARVSKEVTITYEAVVENGLRVSLAPGLRQHRWSELPAETLQYLTGSRYCPSDLFVSFATREFGHLEGSDRILAAIDWIHRHVDYRPGVSNSETTAERTFVERAGVCRDFSHLAITLARALNFPARAVSAYALDLAPADFHAIFEVYVGGSWWLVDPTRLAPIDGLVRVGVGRDAADIAFLSTSLPCDFLAQVVEVTRA